VTRAARETSFYNEFLRITAASGPLRVVWTNTDSVGRRATRRRQPRADERGAAEFRAGAGDGWRTGTPPPPPPPPPDLPVQPVGVKDCPRADPHGEDARAAGPGLGAARASVTSSVPVPLRRRELSVAELLDEDVHRRVPGPAPGPDRWPSTTSTNLEPDVPHMRDVGVKVGDLGGRRDPGGTGRD